MSPRRQLTMVVLGCLAGAGVALFAAGRGWLVETTVRPGPLPDQVTTLTGGDLRPWLPALGWAALAGAGALLATRAGLRRVIGGLLVAAGAGLSAGALSAAAGEAQWSAAPVATAAGGVLVAAAGVVAALASGRWPAMGARYERTRPGDGRPGGRVDGPPRAEAGEPAPSTAALRSEQLWKALDQGDDPTAR